MTSKCVSDRYRFTFALNQRLIALPARSRLLYWHLVSSMGCSDLKFLLIALLLLMSKTCLPPCSALEEQPAQKTERIVFSDSQATEKIFAIDRAVVLECISLSRFNI